MRVADKHGYGGCRTDSANALFTYAESPSSWFGAPTAIAEAGEYYATSLPGGGCAVHGIEPVDGWVLTYADGDTSDRQSFWAPREYAAVRGNESVFLGVSPRNFTPSQDRFAWLVRAGFPACAQRADGVFTPICDEDIDAALALGEAA